MKKVKIEITNCKSKLFWYADKIGKTYDATISFFGKAMIDVGNDTLYVQKEDFEIVKESKSEASI
jgi:hypothetical protein